MNGVDSCPAPPDEMLMMLPPPVAAMCGTTARQIRYRLRTFTRIDSSHWSTVESANADAGRCHRVVHEHVDAVVLVDRRVDQVLDVVGDPDVTAHREGAAARVLDPGDRLVDRAGQAVGMLVDGARRAHDLRAQARQADRQALADPSGRAGHDDDASGEVDVARVRARLLARGVGHRGDRTKPARARVQSRR